MDIYRTLQALLSVFGISVGQLFLKMAAINLSNPNSIGIWFFGIRVNIYLLLGVGILGISTLMWIWVLRNVPLSLAYPIMGLAFIVVPLLCYFVLGEALNWRFFFGGALIGAGLVAIYA